MYKYSLNSSKKFVCPKCGTENKFVKYIDNTTSEYINGGFGKCDREESCGYHLKPENSFIKDSESKIKYIKKDLYNSDNLNNDLYLKTFHLIQNANKEYNKNNLIKNVFIEGLIKRFGKDKVRKAYNDYKLGMGFNNAIMFPYYHNEDLKTAKIIAFKPDLHRDKDFSPLWLHSAKNFTYTNQIGNYKKVLNNCYPDENIDYNEFKYYPDAFSQDPDEQPEPFNLCLPLFGWQLVDLKENKDKTICLVESEKTAVICSIAFPEYVWLATGGKGFIQSYKFNYNNGRNWYIFPDLSTNDNTKNYWIECINKVKIKNSYRMNETYIDYIPCDLSKENTLIAKEKGLDIADFILDYNLSCGKYSNYIEFMKAVLDGSYEPIKVKTDHELSTFENFCINRAKEGILVEENKESGYNLTTELKQELNQIITEFNQNKVTTDKDIDNVIIEPIIEPIIKTPVINLNPVIASNKTRPIEELLKLISESELNK